MNRIPFVRPSVLGGLSLLALLPCARADVLEPNAGAFLPQGGEVALVRVDPSPQRARRFHGILLAAIAASVSMGALAGLPGAGRGSKPGTTRSDGPTPTS